MSGDAQSMGPMSPSGKRLSSEKETPPNPKSRNQSLDDGPLSTEQPMETKTSVMPLPSPYTDLEWWKIEWFDHAACKGQTDLFFEHRCSSRCNAHAHGCDRLECVRVAREICNTCLVFEQCRTWSVEHDLQYGVAGGLTERERSQLRKERKHDV